MNAQRVVLMLAACLLVATVSPAEASRFLCRPGHWKKATDCNSFYGDTCRDCCSAFQMYGYINKKAFTMSPCKCVPLKQDES